MARIPAPAPAASAPTRTITTPDGESHTILSETIWSETIGDHIWDAWAVLDSSDVVLVITPIDVGGDRICARGPRDQAEDARAEAWHMAGLGHSRAR